MEAIGPQQQGHYNRFRPENQTSRQTTQSNRQVVLNKGQINYQTDQHIREYTVCAFNINTPLSNIEFVLDGTKIDVSKLGPPLQSDFFNFTYPENPVDIWGPVKPGTYTTSQASAI